MDIVAQIKLKEEQVETESKEEGLA